MSKKKKIPKTIQNKFKKKQFKIGDFVYITWLNTEYYGYIKKITERPGKILSYLVQTEKYAYPCGLLIKGYKSGTVGSIDIDKTKEIGQQKFKELSNKATRERKKPTNINRNTTSKKRKKDISTTDTVSTRPRKSTAKRSNRRKNDSVSRSNSSSKSNTKSKGSTKRSKVKPDKQSDFLKKFTS